MKKGVSLYITILILSILTATLLSLVSISISQIKIIWATGNSVRAFFAADSGIEEALFRARQQGDFSDFSGEVNEALYQVDISIGPELVVESIGSYRETNRAIEARY